MAKLGAWQQPWKIRRSSKSVVKNENSSPSNPNRIAACTITLALLTGCASQAAMDNLAMAQQQYNVVMQRCMIGDQTACAAFPAASANLVQAQQQVEAEKQASAAIGLEAAALGVAAAAASSSPDFGPPGHPPPGHPPPGHPPRPPPPRPLP